MSIQLLLITTHFSVLVICVFDYISNVNYPLLLYFGYNSITTVTM